MSTLGSVVAGLQCDLEPGNWHFMSAGCDHCDARRVAAMTLQQVENWYRYGNIRQPVYEAYMHAWATGAPRFSTLGHGWETPPTDPEVIALVQLIRTKGARP